MSARLTAEEQRLVAGCRAGDQAAWSALYRAYAADVGRFLNGTLRSDETWLAQIFLKDPRADTNSVAGVLLSDGEVLAGERVELSADTMIGIDLYYRADAAPFDEGLAEDGTLTIDGETYRYGRVQDAPVFDDGWPFTEGSVEGSAAYTFALGASEDAPEVSTAGCFVTVVVDFSEVEALAIAG